MPLFDSQRDVYQAAENAVQDAVWDGIDPDWLLAQLGGTAEGAADDYAEDHDGVRPGG